MTKTKSYKRKCVTIKLNTLIVHTMVREIIDDLYGTTPNGRRYGFEDTALKSLREAAERFLENMWEQLRQLSHNNVVTVEHIRFWKQTTDFKPRFKKNKLSLCKIFN
jgi:hypothetical protein